MAPPLLAPSEKSLILQEQVRTYFNEANDQNLAGALVQTLVAVLVHEQAPLWTWAPGLLCLYLISAYRAHLFRQYQRHPESRSPLSWANSQAITGGLAGVCWGFSNTAMLAYVPLESQLLLLVVTAVSASSSGNESFADPMPPRTFILASVVPMALWLFTVEGSFHRLIGVMLLILAVLTLGQGIKRHRAFVEALKLRFEKERLARELASQRDVVARAAQAKTRFLAAASHDLRQPVQALNIYLQLLAGEIPDDSEGANLLARAIQAGDSINQLLDNLLDISKLDASITQVNRQDFPLAPLLDRLAEEYQTSARDKGLSLRLHPTRARINTDPVLLERVLRNLLSNALRYTRKGGVLIGCRARGNKLHLQVWDTGIGIPTDQQQAVFTEFYQVSTRQERPDGLGLGLAIVERITQLLGHQVHLRSVLGRGSCFSLEIPLALAPSPADLDAPDTLNASPLAGHTIALIENNEEIRAGLEMLLQRQGCRVLPGTSAAEIMAQAQQQAQGPDAIISDLGLGSDENGIDCIRQLRQHFAANLPAILITGDTSQSALVAAASADLVLLHKPIAGDILIKTLKHALSKVS